MKSNWTEAFGRSIVKWRWAYFFLVLLVSIASVLAIFNRFQAGVPVDFTPQALVFGDNPELERLREIETTFGREDNDLLLIVNGEGLESESGRSYLEQLHRAATSANKVVAVDSVVNASVVGGDGFLPELTLLWDDSETAIAKASADSFLSGRLVSQDGRTTVVRIRLDPVIEKVADLQPIVNEITVAVAQIQVPAGLELHVTGVPFVRNEVVSMMMADNFYFAPILSVVFLIVIMFIFRRVTVSMAPMVGVLMAVLWSLGVLCFFDITFNILSILIPILGLIIGVADGIHILTRYQESLLKRPDSREWAMGQTLRHMTKACFLTTFTTAAGFLSLLSAQTMLIRDFGLHCAIAVMIAYVAVILVTPLYLAFLPSKWVVPKTDKQYGHRFDSLNTWVSRHSFLSIGLVLFLTVVAAVSAMSLQANSRLLEMYRPNHSTYQAIKLAESKLAGVVPIFVHFEVSEGSMLEPERLQVMSTIESALQKQEITIQTLSLSGVISEIHGAFTGKHEIPSTAEGIHQELLAVQLSGELPLSGLKSLDGKQARILATARDDGGRKYIQLKSEMDGFIHEIQASHDMRIEVTGDGMMASLGIDELISDLLSSLGWIIGVISLTMLVLLRSFSLMIISVIPNLIPLIFSLATLNWMGVDLQLSNIISFSVSIGLAIDDTIHFMVRYRQEREEGSTHEDAIKNTFRSAGKAIVLTSILLVAGFGILASSELTTTHHFGILSCVTLIGAVLADLILLPALLNVKERFKVLRQLP